MPTDREQDALSGPGCIATIVFAIACIVVGLATDARWLSAIGLLALMGVPFVTGPIWGVFSALFPNQEDEKTRRASSPRNPPSSDDEPPYQGEPPESEG